MRHLRHMQGAGDGRLPQVPGREQEGLVREAGLRRSVGRVQSLVPLLLHVPVGQAEQQVPPVPTGMVDTEDGEVDGAPGVSLEGLRQYKCEQCFRSFFERHHLTVHLRSHTGERPFACNFPGCGKSFADRQKMKRHQKALHEKSV